MKHYRIILYPLIFISVFFIYIKFYNNPFKKYTVDKYLISSIIAENINDSMTNYEKVKILHDYIILNTEYDSENLENNSIPDISYTAKGVFEKKIAVCRGYAEAFKLLMDKINIECIILTGTANNTSHAWNAVKINDKWYHIDCTFDDPVSDNTSVYASDNLRYDYFLINDQQIFKDHILDCEAPICSDDSYMYQEKKYNIPYEVLDSVTNLPKAYSNKFLSGIKTTTFYFPENIEMDSSGYIDKIGTILYANGNKVTNCVYTPIVQCGKYYYTTITFSSN